MRKFRLRKQKPKIERDVIPLRVMVPNLVTMMSAAAGITSIRFSCTGSTNHDHFRIAVIMIVIACFLDGIDGGVARMLKATSKLGAQLDSLADFVSFGVAPALFTYFWIMDVVQPDHSLYPIRGVFWAFALFYALCCAFRLARFNIMLDDQITQPYWKHFFMGLPAPGGAGLLLTPAIWQLHTDMDLFQSPLISSATLLIFGTLMASRFPTPSLKKLRIPARYQIPFLIFVLFLIGMLIAHSWLTLGCIGIAYIVTIPLCGYLYLKAKRRHESRAGNTHILETPRL